MRRFFIILISLLLSLLLIGCDKGGEAPTDAPTDKASEKPTELQEPVELPEGAVMLSTEEGHAYFCVHEFKKVSQKEEEDLFNNFVFRSFFALLSKCLLIHTEKRSRLGFCRGMNAFRLQSARYPQRIARRFFILFSFF